MEPNLNELEDINKCILLHELLLPRKVDLEKFTPLDTVLRCR